MRVISKALGNIVGPTAKSHLVTARYILCPMISISVSPQVPVALLPLSCYQNQHSFAAENLVGDMLSGPDNSQTKIKCKLKTEMPKIGDPRKISTTGSCLLLLCLSLALSISDLYKKQTRTICTRKKTSLGSLLPPTFCYEKFQTYSKAERILFIYLFICFVTYLSINQPSYFSDTFQTKLWSSAYFGRGFLRPQMSGTHNQVLNHYPGDLHFK